MQTQLSMWQMHAAMCACCAQLQQCLAMHGAACTVLPLRTPQLLLLHLLTCSPWCHCSCQKLTECGGLLELPSLTYLALQDNYVDRLPEEMSALTALETLHICTDIGWEPRGQGLRPLLALTSLTQLVLNFDIPEWGIPDGLGSLPRLKVRKGAVP